MNELRIREAGTILNNDSYIAKASDSTIPYLEAIGSGDMWARGGSPSGRGMGHLLIFIADAEVELGPLALQSPFLSFARARLDPAPAHLRYWNTDDEMSMLSVGVLLVCDDRLPGHIKRQILHTDAIPAELTGHQHKRTGEALLKQAKDYGLERGANTLYLDVRARNGRKLVEFVRKQGFSIVVDYEHTREEWHDMAAYPDATWTRRPGGARALTEYDE
ncbi:hypothetical protein LY78DRAFT_681911 [Colletotrichum sublineola]|uniref:Putative acetyltransferase n=1 Tax=Colletotrichum sublineola TaxID=1173701 RepID=A0A066X4F4_COLSU|nr:hypothetical protein LY78DRAFT_681911 [Colletotrichum sublineola]KDN64028.1 putative acetyltransferase [Colletotrichum sublineola]